MEETRLFRPLVLLTALFQSRFSTEEFRMNPTLVLFSTRYPHDSLLKSGLYEYKLYGILNDCAPELCADVYTDLNYRPKWDQFVRDICEKTHDGRPAIYWEVKFPFPLTNRDYVFTRERRDMEVDGRKIYVILAKSVQTNKFPEKSGIVRVKAYRQGVAFESDGKKGSKVFMTYFDDPGGKLPSWLVNWATKTGVPNFLKDMQKACHTYRKK
nr:phosphatidylcholine transfer protein [Pogona vitticeps]